MRNHEIDLILAGLESEAGRAWMAASIEDHRRASALLMEVPDKVMGSGKPAY